MTIESEIRLVLLVIGCLLIIAIFWDGLRRQRNRQQKVSAQALSAEELALARQVLNESLQEDSFDADVVESKSQHNQAAFTAHVGNIAAATMIEADDDFDQSVINESDEIEEEALEGSEIKEEQFEPQTPAAPVAETKPEAAKPAQKTDNRVVMFTVVAPEGKSFGGFKLLQVLLNNGFRFGDMNIFHYHENREASGKKLFSLAAATNTGEFQLSNMANFHCKGLVLFMNTAEQDHSQAVFEEMVEVTESLAETLEGKLCIGESGVWDEAQLKALHKSL